MRRHSPASFTDPCAVCAAKSVFSSLVKLASEVRRRARSARLGQAGPHSHGLSLLELHVRSEDEAYSMRTGSPSKHGEGASAYVALACDASEGRWLLMPGGACFPHVLLALVRWPVANVTRHINSNFRHTP